MGTTNLIKACYEEKWSKKNVLTYSISHQTIVDTILYKLVKFAPENTYNNRELLFINQTKVCIIKKCKTMCILTSVASRRRANMPACTHAAFRRAPKKYKKHQNMINGFTINIQQELQNTKNFNSGINTILFRL